MKFPIKPFIALILAAFSQLTFAITNTVTVGPGGGVTFNPVRLTNHVGDTVHFVPASGGHSVSPNFTSQLFCGSGNISAPCDVTFLNTGNFGYKCIPHFSSSMTGMVVVLASTNVAPIVSITNPAPGTLFLSPTNFTIQASATDVDGTVSQVQFFAGATSLGTDTSSPFSVVATGLNPGNYALTARATDSSGSTTTSGVVNITINSLPVASMTLPASGAVLIQNSPFTIRANALDTDGSIQQVRFYANGSLLGTSTNTSTPFSLKASNLVAGSYAFTARVTDNRNATSTSAVVNATMVAPVLSQLSTNLVVTNGNFSLTLSVTPGLNYNFERSTNLSAWSNVLTFTAVSNSYTYTNPVGSTPRQFYRGLLLPNP